MKPKIKVLIVDDSAVVRQVARTQLEVAPDIEVIAAVADPVFAIDRLRNEWPDVILLDIEMPRMDGITFLKKIMAERPTPVVICSTLAEKGAKLTLEALSAGAVSVITKPKTSLRQFLEEAGTDLVSAIRGAAMARPRVRPSVAAAPMVSAPAGGGVQRHAVESTTDRIVALGTSTGGTQALEAVLTRLPPDCPGIVVVQHMPEKFTAMFAERLNGICAIDVKEARDGDRVLAGRALIAPGGRHMELVRSGAHYSVSVKDGPLINRHKPSVDVLFNSVARAAQKNALGVIMTGMGDDGARGLVTMREAGAHTVAEDESTCVVFGMPKEAIKRGGACEIMPLDRIPMAIMQFAKA